MIITSLRYVFDYKKSIDVSSSAVMENKQYRVGSGYISILCVTLDPFLGLIHLLISFESAREVIFKYLFVQSTFENSFRS